MAQPSAPSNKPCPIAQIDDYISQHLADSLDLATLGRVAGFSRSHFGRLFRQQFGRTPHQHVMRCRVEKAALLLATTNKKGIEIAFLCGFSDETLLARWFRRVLGCRPSDCRAGVPRAVV